MTTIAKHRSPLRFGESFTFGKFETLQTSVIKPLQEGEGFFLWNSISIETFKV